MSSLAAPPSARLRKSPRRERAANTLAACAGPAAGGAMLWLAWQLASLLVPEIPGPASTLAAAIRLFEHPFHRGSPGHIGMGWNILASLGRVATVFSLALAVGIPTGFLIGRYKALDAMCSPLIRLLRPVSPLAWLPLGLLMFRSPGAAAIWAIFVCSVWPVIINTADGVRQSYPGPAGVPARSAWKRLDRALPLAALPHLITGARVSMGTAWFVIVAVESLAGGTGLGFWLWHEWHGKNVEHVLISIFIIGLIGMLLDTAVLALGRRCLHGKARPITADTGRTERMERNENPATVEAS